jgi:hypothetical protein
MNPAPGTAASNGGDFDPRQAAALLDQTTQQTRHRLEPAQPWLLVIRAATVLTVFGAVWLNVRGQHPYRHPTAAAIPVVITFGVLNLAATVTVARRATAGVSGRSRLRRAEIAVMAVIWAGVFVVMAALAGAGVSDPVVYGLYPVTVRSPSPAPRPCPRDRPGRGRSPTRACALCSSAPPSSSPGSSAAA